MKTIHNLRCGILAFIATLGSISAQVPQLINYQGRVVVGTTNFDGVGQFKFALVNAAGDTTFWSNDGTSTAGSEPTASVSLTVAKGLYSVLLGDATLANMTVIPNTVFNNADVQLRVWFNDGVNGFQLLTPDQRIAAVGYAMMAGNAATVADGAITSAKIANGAVGSTQLATNAVQSANIASGAVGTTQLADFAITGGKLRLGAEAGTTADGVLGISSGTMTFTRTFAYPFTTAPKVSLLTPGWTLEVVSASGFSATAPFSPVAVVSAGSVGQYTSLVVVNGNPAISFHDVTNGNLMYVRATDASGSTWGAPVTLDSPGNVGTYTSMTVVDGNPAISYYDSTNSDLKYVRASDANGTVWGTPVTVDSSGNVGQYNSLAVAGGFPAISYYDSSNGDLKYVRASDASGTAWSTPTTVASDGSVGQYTSLVVVAGNPAISYHDATNADLKYVRASDPGGSTWGTPATLDSSGAVGDATSMKVVNGNPAICYRGDFNTPTTRKLKYLRATDASGTTWGSPVTVNNTEQISPFISLAVVDGNPAISYFSPLGGGILRYVSATDATGTTWDTPASLDFTLGGSIGQFNSLAEVNGSPAISYYDGKNFDLKFLRLPDLRWYASDGTVAPLTAATVTEGAIGTSQLAANAVQSGNIAPGAVGTTRLAAGAVQSGNIALGAVTAAQIATGAVTATQIAPGAVDFASLAKPPQSGRINGSFLEFDFGQAPFTVVFPQSYPGPPVVTLALAPASSEFPMNSAVLVTATSATQFSGKLETFTSTPVIADSAGNAGQYASMAVVNGNPALSYFESNGQDLKFARASNSNGTTWGTPVSADSAGNVGTFTSLAVVSGNPAISYYDSSNGDLKFVRASNSSGTAWNLPSSVDFTADVGQYTSLKVVNGNPAISYHDATNGGLKYARALVPDGTFWGPPNIVTVDSTGNVGLYTSLAVVNGNPAIAYFDSTNLDLKYVRANDASGTAWGAPITVDAAGSVGFYASLEVVNGNPAISYRDFTNSRLRYVRATDANGTTWGTPVTVDSTTPSVGIYTSLRVIDGNPAISYHDATNTSLKYARATDAAGSAWGIPVTLDSVGIVGSHTTMEVVNGSPAIGYFDQTNGNLNYVRQTNPSTTDFTINWIALPP